LHSTESLSVKRHGITKIMRAIGHSSAVKADILGIFGEFFYLIKEFIAGQNTEMAFMISSAYFFTHGFTFQIYYFNSLTMKS
jgi:hypothetical protein